MIDKSQYQAPAGLGGIDDIEPDVEIEIEIENPDAVHLDLGDMHIDIESAEDLVEDFHANLVDTLSEGELRSIASELLNDFEDDNNSRRDWMETYIDGIELLGMKLEERSEPWEGACGVYHPLLSEALVKFQAETMTATFPAAGCVRTQIVGKDTQENKEAAARVEEDMNYQLLEVMTEFRPEHERMLWGLGLSGNAFKKVYYDPSLDRPVSVFIPAEDIVVPYGATSIESAPRVTHVMRKTENELRKLQVSGFYSDVELGEPSLHLDDIEKKIADKMGFSASSDDRFKVLEMHVELDLPGQEHVDENGDPTGINLPYIVTIEKSTQTVLSIRRNWSQGDDTYKKRQHFVHYGYVPGFGFYCFGLIHLVGAFAKSGTSLIRQLVDAGTLSNLPGGFKSRGLRVKGDDTPISPGEFRDVDVPSGTIRDNLMPLPYKEPSQVLMALLGQIVEEGRRFANAADIQIADMSGQAPVGTTLAILERTLKVMSAVQARIHYSMRQELKLLKTIIAETTPDSYDYEPDEGSRKAKRSDYSNVAVLPVSDPNASTMAQKIIQYQSAIQLAQGAPQLYNMAVLHRQMLDVLGIKDVNKLIPMAEDLKPIDPVSENQNALRMKPLKAFLNQDHKSHIQVHMSLLQDPMVLQVVQGNPQMQQMQAALMAHVSEHVGFQYRKDIEEQLGMGLPPKTDDEGEDVSLDPEVEAQLSPMLAQAAQQLVQQHTAQAAQAKAMQQAQDPIIQMQQQELQLKAQEQQRKAQKDQADIQLKTQELQLEKYRIDVTQSLGLGQQHNDLTKVQLQDASKQAIEDKKIKVSALKDAAQMVHEQKQMKVDALKTAAELTAKEAKGHIDLAHKGFQEHLNRTHDVEGQVKKMAHEGYQSMLDRTNGVQENMLDIAHQGHQAELNRDMQEKFQTPRVEGDTNDRD